MICVDVYNAAKTLIGGYASPDKSVLTTWKEFNVSFTSPADARYAKVKLYNFLPSVACVNYLDDVIFSEMRAAMPTAEVVNDVVLGVFDTYTIPSGAYTDTLHIASTHLTKDSDYTFINFRAGVPSWIGTPWFFRIRDATVGVVSGRVLYLFSTDERQNFSIGLPWNVKGHDLYVQVYQDSGASQTITMGPYSWHGFSPHMHR